MSKHTPGPWKAIRHGNFIEIEPVVSLSTKNQEMLDLRLSPHAEIMANANLIAAAPELLNACVSALGELSLISTGRGRTGMTVIVIKKLLKALSKAEGREE